MTNYAYLEKTRAQGEIYRGLFEQGLSVLEIAQQAGVNRSTVERWVYKIFKCPKRHPHSSWTEEMDNTLKEMWNQGVPARDIGKAVGMSKNAVLGRKFRLKLEDRRSGCTGLFECSQCGAVRYMVGEPCPHCGLLPHRKPRKPRAKGVRIAPIVRKIPEPASDPVRFMDLADHHCREVIGKGQDGLASYCGGGRVSVLYKGTSIYISSYCAYHFSINHQP